MSEEKTAGAIKEGQGLTRGSARLDRQGSAGEGNHNQRGLVKERELLRARKRRKPHRLLDR
jgi:hypothetical protein